MSKVDDARTAVNGVDAQFSGIEDFVDAYTTIVDAGKTIKESERAVLQIVVGNFRGKIPDGNDFQKLRDSARRFEEDLTATIIGAGMANIAARNAELLQMKAALGIQNAAIAADANKLQQITANIDKATDTVKTIKNLASSLTNADASKIAKLQAIITALEELGGIFQP